MAKKRPERFSDDLPGTFVEPFPEEAVQHIAKISELTENLSKGPIEDIADSIEDLSATESKALALLGSVSAKMGDVAANVGNDVLGQLLAFAKQIAQLAATQINILRDVQIALDRMSPALAAIQTVEELSGRLRRAGFTQAEIDPLLRSRAAAEHAAELREAAGRRHGRAAAVEVIGTREIRSAQQFAASGPVVGTLNTAAFAANNPWTFAQIMGSLIRRVKIFN
jgi:hypothetical protein